MDTRELIDLADRLSVVAACLMEDIHPALVAEAGIASVAAGKASSLAQLADQLHAISRCVVTLISLAEPAS
jgi:hypothetical protein